MTSPSHQFTVNEICFELLLVEVSGANNRFSAKLKPTDRGELSPLCYAISTCWSRERFIDLVVERAGLGIEGATGFFFYKPDEDDGTPPPELRVEIKEGQRGVIAYYFEDDIEVSVGFFVKLVSAFSHLCLDKGIVGGVTRESLKLLEKSFASEISDRSVSE